jgi:hypothetical protein
MHLFGGLGKNTQNRRMEEKKFLGVAFHKWIEKLIF